MNFEPETPRTVVIDEASPAGAWRAALAPDASCAVCKQAECAHSDLEYQGIVPELARQ